MRIDFEKCRKLEHLLIYAPTEQVVTFLGDSPEEWLVNYMGEGGYLMLAQAAKRDDVEMVRLFLDKGAEPNDKLHPEISPIVEAARSRRYDVVRLLIEKKAWVDLPVIKSIEADYARRGSTFPCANLLYNAYSQHKRMYGTQERVDGELAEMGAQLSAMMSDLPKLDNLTALGPVLMAMANLMTALSAGCEEAEQGEVYQSGAERLRQVAALMGSKSAERIVAAFPRDNQSNSGSNAALFQVDIEKCRQVEKFFGSGLMDNQMSLLADILGDAPQPGLLNYRCKSGYLFIAEAVKHCTVDVVRSLLNHGAKTNDELFPERSVLVVAVQRGHESIHEFLVERGVWVDLPVIQSVVANYTDYAGRKAEFPNANILYNAYSQHKGMYGTQERVDAQLAEMRAQLSAMLSGLNKLDNLTALAPVLMEVANLMTAISAGCEEAEEDVYQSGAEQVRQVAALMGFERAKHIVAAFPRDNQSNSGSTSALFPKPSDQNGSFDSDDDDDDDTSSDNDSKEF